MKKKVILSFCVVFLVLLAGSYFAYKFISLTFTYKVGIDGEYKDFEIVDTITINKATSNRNDYVILNNVKVVNYFDDFELMENMSDKNNVKYALYDDNDREKLKASFWMGSDITFMEIFKSDAIFFGDTNENGAYNKINRKAILEKYNITNDIEFLNLLVDAKKNKNYIFTSIKEMQENYVLQTFIDFTIPNGNSITLINGDYTGFILCNKSFKEIHILRDDKMYYFTFLKLDYFTDELIQEIMSTVVID